MKDIALPVLPHDTPLRTAIAVMHTSQKSGLVTMKESAVLLIRAGDVLKALRTQPRSTIGHIEGVTISMLVAGTLRVERSGGLEWRVTGNAPPPGVPIAPQSIDWVRFDAFFKQTTYDYAIDTLAIGTAVVITRSEGREAQLNTGPMDCYCEGPRQHGYRAPHPPICPRDQMPVNCWS